MTVPQRRPVPGDSTVTSADDGTSRQPDTAAAGTAHAAAIAVAREYLDRSVIVPGYTTFDREAHLGASPWNDPAAISVWEQAHGHDVRLKCYVEFGCVVIESEAMAVIAGLLDTIDHYGIPPEPEPSVSPERQKLAKIVHTSFMNSGGPVTGRWELDFADASLAAGYRLAPQAAVDAEVLHTTTENGPAHD